MGLAFGRSLIAVAWGGGVKKKVILCSLISDLSMSSTSSSNTNSGTNVFLLKESAVKGD